MSTQPVLSYGTGGRGITCPLCRRLSCSKKMYGHDVCKKCFYAFANRRQIAYLIDAILLTIVDVPVIWGIWLLLQRLGPAKLVATVVMACVSMVFVIVFMCKDSFGGHSPGKYLMGVQVLDDKTGQPGTLVQSVKRNIFLLLGQIPQFGLVVLIPVVIIAYQVPKGYRLFDRFAKTRVIWKKHAHLPVFGGTALACESCGYDLTANVSGTCPECGKAVSERNRELLAGAQAPPSS